MLPICIALKIISTIENISFILYVYYCHLNHLFCQILVVTPRYVHMYYLYYYYYYTLVWYLPSTNSSCFSAFCFIVFLLVFAFVLFFSFSLRTSIGRKAWEQVRFNWVWTLPVAFSLISHTFIHSLNTHSRWLGCNRLSLILKRLGNSSRVARCGGLNAWSKLLKKLKERSNPISTNNFLS